MITMTKTLRGYISQIPIWGAVSLFAGLIVIFIVFTSNHKGDWVTYYIPFKILGAVLGYMWVTYWNPGQLVTFHFDKFTPTEDEKALNNLIFKYRSKTLMFLFPVIFILADLLIGKSRYHQGTGDLDGYFASLFIGSVVTLFTSNGIKSLSAWWNIRKNWKEEFEN